MNILAELCAEAHRINSRRMLTLPALDAAAKRPHAEPYCSNNKRARIRTGTVQNPLIERTP